MDKSWKADRIGLVVDDIVIPRLESRIDRYRSSRNNLPLPGLYTAIPHYYFSTGRQDRQSRLLRAHSRRRGTIRSPDKGSWNQVPSIVARKGCQWGW